MADRVALGFRCHSGWAVLVAVRGSSAAPVVLDRRRVQLVDDSLPRMPYHGVAEYGMPPSVIEDVIVAAAQGAAAALKTTEQVDIVGLVATERRVPDELDAILASHPLLHAAEGQLYERAVIDAAAEAGLRVHVVEPRSIVVPPAVDTLRRSIGAPWQKDHKWAATAALAALADG